MTFNSHFQYSFISLPAGQYVEAIAASLILKQMTQYLHFPQLNSCLQRVLRRTSVT